MRSSSASFRGVGCRGAGVAGLRNQSGQNVDPLKSRESTDDHLASMEDEGCGGECGAVGWNPTLPATGAALAGIVRQNKPARIGFSGSCLCHLQVRLCAGWGTARPWSRIEKSQREKLDPLKSRESIDDHLALLEDEGCGGECRAVG